MNILVVGLGSMGKRRIRLTKLLYPDFCIFGVDLSKERQQEAIDVGASKCYDSIVDAIKNVTPKVAIICSPPLSHAEIINECLDYGIHVFTELNLVDTGYNDLIKKADNKGLTLFLSSTLLYRKDVQYIINKAKGNKVNYIYHCGQYLPDWHPWENYKDFFVGNPRTNGCREILAIDIPWLVAAMGDVENFSIRKGKLSNLDIDYSDYYIINFDHKSGSRGVVCVDVVSRKATRSLTVYSENMHILWDGTPASLKSFNLKTKNMEQIQTYEHIDKDIRYSDNVIENAYSDELITFFSAIDGQAKALYGFSDDLKTLALINEIESR